MKILSIDKVIPEKNIVIFSPHFDDVLFMTGGYLSELKKANLLNTKSFHVQLLFSRSNYQCGHGEKNFDTSIERIKLATGNRLIEDQNCNDELLGFFNYTYELCGELECFARGKAFADSEMEFPHGMYDDFTDTDKEIFARMEQRILKLANQENTALIFPMAIKEHIDHFITREAAMSVAKKLGRKSKATFYVIEDKPYGGIATDEELGRMEAFISNHKLKSNLFEYDTEVLLDLAFKHYISQVEDVYKTGVRNRALFWKEKFNTQQGLDRICKL